MHHPATVAKPKLVPKGNKTFDGQPVMLPKSKAHLSSQYPNKIHLSTKLRLTLFPISGKPWKREAYREKLPKLLQTLEKGHKRSVLPYVTRWVQFCIWKGINQNKINELQVIEFLTDFLVLG